MDTRNVIWTPAVRAKLIEFRSPRYTPEETLDFISQLILETEDLLINPHFGKSYTEEYGRFKGVSRIVIKRFQIYFKPVNIDIVILFPGENK